MGKISLMKPTSFQFIGNLLCLWSWCRIFSLQKLIERKILFEEHVFHRNFLPCQKERKYGESRFPVNIVPLPRHLNSVAQNLSFGSPRSPPFVIRRTFVWLHERSYQRRRTTSTLFLCTCTHIHILDTEIYMQ